MNETYFTLMRGVLDKPIINLTTARYGYEPSEWGTVTGTVNMAVYKASVQAGVAFNELPAELLYINGTPVRHTLPFNPPRPCEKSTYEQYQWVKGDSLFTIPISYNRDEEITPEKNSSIEFMVNSLVKNARYEPLRKAQ